MPTATRIHGQCLAPGRAVDAPATGGACDAAAEGAQVGRDPDAKEAAGWPVFGQFVAHDITADRSP